MRHQGDSFTTTDIMKLGIKRERLKEWMFKNYFSPSIQTATGSGTKNLYSRLDLYFIKLFQELVELGFSRQHVSKRLLWVREDMEYSDLPRNKPILAIIQFDGDDNLQPNQSWFFDSNALSRLGGKIYNSPKGEFKNVLLVNFGAICEKVDAAIDAE